MPKKERGETTNVMIRLSPEELAEVDAMIEAGKFTTRSNCLKTALQQMLRRELYLKDFHTNLLNDLEDPDTRRALREAMRQLMAESMFGKD